MNEKELLKLKEKISNAEQEVQQLKGRKKQILAQLTADFSCSTIKEAKEKKKQLKSEYEKTKSKLDAVISEIEKKYHENAE